MIAARYTAQGGESTARAARLDPLAARRLACAPMKLDLRRYEPADLEALRALVSESSLAAEFDMLQGPGALEGALADPFLIRDGLQLAFVDGELVGFCEAFVPPGAHGRFAMLRLGVSDRRRRLGIGTRLLARVREVLERDAADVGEINLTAWLPAEAAAAFAARHGYGRVRSFWLMERPQGASPAPVWPAEIERRLYDGSETMLREMNAAYRDSFARHYHFINTSVDDTRAFFSRPNFRPDGLLMAYRGGACVGFCRCELFERRGEVALLGTTTSARGIGLGRALLRWGVEWIERERAARTTLLVDGENEGALSLYRSEGFVVARTRDIWSIAAGGTRT
jgi:mycothiol synthase